MSERRVASGWVVEVVDIACNSVFGFESGIEFGAPDQFSFQGLEESFDYGVVIGGSFAGP